MQVRVSKKSTPKISQKSHLFKGLFLSKERKESRVSSSANDVFSITGYSYQ